MTQTEPTTTAADAGSRRPLVDIGVIGGSGLYAWLQDAHEVPVDTPFGPPSDPPVVGEVAGRRVAFLPRHGRDHRFPPHRVNYRANLWALRSLGARQVVGPCAVGSMHSELRAGALVVPDQLVDRTWGRAHTVFDDPGVVVHVAFADPYCPRGRGVAVRASAAAGWSARDGGTLLVINGPRFSTRAESRGHAAAGADVVGMTAAPEAAIARELALCYTNLAVVTDLDAGFEAGDGVTHAEVLEVFGRSVERLKSLLVDVVAALPTDDECSCRHALDGLRLPFQLP